MLPIHYVLNGTYQIVYYTLANIQSQTNLKQPHEIVLHLNLYKFNFKWGINEQLIKIKFFSIVIQKLILSKSKQYLSLKYGYCDVKHELDSYADSETSLIKVQEIYRGKIIWCFTSKLTYQDYNCKYLPFLKMQPKYACKDCSKWHKMMCSQLNLTCWTFG